MTTDKTPTDAEIAALRAEFGITSNGRGIKEFMQVADFARAVLAKWGSPVVAVEPVAPDFYTACAWHEGGGIGGWIALPGYSNETERGVKHLVLEAARKEGYKGTAAGRLLELGWEIRPVYLAPQPTQAQAGAVDDTALIRQLKDALDTCGVDYGGDDHAFKTLDDGIVQSAIAAARARLPKESPGGPDVDHPL